MNDFVCENNECVPPKTDECNNKPPECTGETPKAYRECVDNIWVPKTCGGEQVCENGKCVTTVPSDCKEGEFLGCTADNNQKIVQTCNPKGENQVSCDEGKICDSEKKDCIAPPKPEDPCHYNKIQEELKNAMAGCEEAKTTIVSSSTDLTQMDNWHDGGKKSCLVFCGEIHLDTLTDSIPLPPNAKVVGVKEANLSAETLSMPLFIPYNKSKTDSIDSNTFKNLNIAIKQLLISHDGAHAVLANHAKTVTVENVSLSGELKHNNEEKINNVGGLFGIVNGGKLKQISLKDVSIILNKPNAYDVYGEKLDADYNSDIGGIVGLSTNSKLTISLPSASNIMIESGMAARVGGLIGRTESDLDILGNPDHYSEIHDITITKAERDISAVLGSAGRSDSNIIVSMKDLSVKVNQIQSTFDSAAGLLGYMHDNTLDVQNIQLTVTDVIKAGNYSGGVFGYIENNIKTSINNIVCHVNKIHAEIDEILSKHESLTKGHGAGGIFGAIRAQKGDVSVSNVYLFANSIQSDKYAGGFVGDLRTGENKNYSFVHNSNVVKEITAKEGVGGFIGFVKSDNKITIEQLQNIVLTLKSTDNDTYPGGVMGRLNNNSTIDQIKLHYVTSYSQRNQNSSRLYQGALISSDKCKIDGELFKETLYVNDIKVDDNYNATACINGIQGNTGNRLHRIWTKNECKNLKTDGFTCTEVKVKDSKAPITIPLFEPSIVDTAGNIQW